jgi:hypothetical protein
MEPFASPPEAAVIHDRQAILGSKHPAVCRWPQRAGIFLLLAAIKAPFAMFRLQLVEQFCRLVDHCHDFLHTFQILISPA